MPPTHRPADGIAAKKIGVVVVTFNTGDIVVECLESLFASRDVDLHVVVVDNNSDDDTRAIVRDWATGKSPFARRADCPLPAIAPVGKPVDFSVHDGDAPFAAASGLTLLQSRVNGGFAYAVNLGIRALLPNTDIDAFWVLNPDCVVSPETASLYLAEAARGPYALLGCRTVYYEAPDQIQSDGGLVDWHTATCKPLNNGKPPATTTLPDAAALDWISGANMVASRAFIAQTGLMLEDYFLYFEEVDWAVRRGDLPLRLVPGTIVYHHGGTSIGTGSTVRRPSPFANYFNYRNRVRFARRHMRPWLPMVYAKAFAKSGQLLLKGAPDEAWAILTGTFELQPPRQIASRITDAAARKLAFGR